MSIKFLKYVISTLLLSLCAVAAQSQTRDEHKKLATQYLLMITKSTPTLEDYYLYESENSEYEAYLVNKICEKNKWIPTASNRECISFTTDHYKNKSRTPSLYFAWLKKKIPPINNLKLISRKKFDRSPDDAFAFWEVSAVLNQNIHLTFFIPITKTGSPNFGIIGLSRIDKKEVADLLQGE